MQRAEKTGLSRIISRGTLSLRYIFFGLLTIGLIYVLIRATKSNNLEVDFLDVGQGDSSLIKIPRGPIILIDGGPDNQVLRRLGENLAFYQRRIDYVVFSHYHDDHITGLIEVLKRYQVSRLIYAASDYNSPILETLYATAAVRGVPLTVIRQRGRLDFGFRCFLEFIAPQLVQLKKDENNSLLARLDCQAKTFLFSGDNNSQMEQGFLRLGLDWSADVFKSSHHGSKTANSLEFLRAVHPRWLVVSVGAFNKFGHPSPEVLDRVKQLGILVRRTDKEGTIMVVIPEAGMTK